MPAYLSLIRVWVRQCVGRFSDVIQMLLAFGFRLNCPECPAVDLRRPGGFPMHMDSDTRRVFRWLLLGVVE